MIEREDFASGTSSKSTKLVHGGVRYLEKAGELAAVLCAYRLDSGTFRYCHISAAASIPCTQLAWPYSSCKHTAS
jgi:hypothetical protein